MDKAECPLCCNAFDYDSHRPRSLPCGHGYCTQCIDTWIHQGDKSCPTCRTVHGFSSAMALPVNFLAEEMLKKTVVSASHNHETEFSHGEQHKVTYDASLSRKVVPVEDEINKKRGNIIVTVQNKAKALQDTEKDLNGILQHYIEHLSKQNDIKKGKEEEVELLIRKIEQIHKDINEKEKSQEEIREFLEGCQKNIKRFKMIVTHFRIAKTSQDIEKQCELASNKILKFSKWEETLIRKISILKEETGILSFKGHSMFGNPLEQEVHGPSAPPADEISSDGPLDHHLSDHLTSQPQDQSTPVKYAQVMMYGVVRSSKVIKEEDRTTIPSLSTEVQPPLSAILIKEYELGLHSLTSRSSSVVMGSLRSTVFMDLSWQGQSLGRVIISVLSYLPEGNEFVRLALGSNGPRFKGATFGDKGSSSITLKEYVTENGEKSSMALSTYSRTNFKTPDRGMLFSGTADKASFVIMTKKDGDKRYWGNFGNVISGLEVIDKAASMYRISDIRIVECGLILNY